MPNHIRVQRRVPRELAELWTNMCPAQVYEVGEDEGDGKVAGRGDAVELRPVRRDHGQGRAPDAARGRLGPGVHADVTEPGTPKVVLGPLFSVGVALGLFGLLRRKRSLLFAGAAAVAADRLLKLGHGGTTPD